MLLYKPKKNQAGKGGKRLLISITVLGSAGPIRLVVQEDELVAGVIGTALKSYSREGRLPVLGSDLNDFDLYCTVAGTEALSPWERIGSMGARNFILCKNQKAGEREGKLEVGQKGNNNNGWKAWFSFNNK
ncbi:uncharacterized protein At4g22758-like isoform X2 [Diospyros lotus]|uniref:uncharacterized protein At4g22758-like isoform X2 n=1 Tax=Diospyros lotus TaxID=55363 RepID=UPI002251EBD3|nr:uncharacterized protein At4g22758-like isoform X2 [Diospyros lotus]